MAVLDTLYIDLVARGLEEATRKADQHREGVRRAAESYRTLTDQMDKAGRNKSFGMGGKDLGSSFADAANGAAKVATALAAASASIIAMTAAGLQGTVQAERLHRAYTEFTRQIASAMLPVVDTLSTALETVNRWLRQAGLTGQQVFFAIAVGIVAATVAATVFLVVLSAVAAAMTLATAGVNVLIAAAAGLAAAFAAAFGAGGTAVMIGLASQFREIRQAVAQLVNALGQLWAASQPLVTAALQIGTALLKAVVIDQWVKMIQLFTHMAVAAERMVSALQRIPAVMSLMAGLRRNFGTLTEGDTRQVRLNQTGTEDAAGTFQRIQQAVLSAGLPEEKDPTLGKLTEIYNRIDTFFTFIEFAMNKAQGGASELVDSVQGAGTQGVRRLGRGLFGLLGM